MDWDLSDWTDEPPTKTAKRDRELVPEGDRVFEIRKATEGAHRFKTAAPTYLMLQLAPAEGDYAWIFWDIPHGKAGVREARQLAEAVGQAVGKTLSIDPDSLAGRRIVAEVYHTVSQKNGQTYANVRRIRVDHTDKRPAWERDAAAASTEVDDIPF